ncbi:aa3 type cytochrome c oxidase subunit IV [Tistlia consotensis]|uniref:Aa3 type cytochrome c oxidase subunit IV n=1 Tax=Tistlia consotensis USBA 355 TaxID=560819 RepID=A0A1Y6CRP8_9PROT|nr:aa3-type cytochrome c oxidase subunit IV [Tistlia consotensis]SMF83314.1 aa3 type cytochrome c oxidase subunit IV [Tistlia consotensis USBA 355]SNS32509.1 aa3 type cytochrome c oxidase subunit IV [Tistlia consotensis]
MANNEQLDREHQQFFETVVRSAAYGAGFIAIILVLMLIFLV